MSPSTLARTETAPATAPRTKPPVEPVARVLAMRDRASELAWVMCGKFGMMGANAALMLLLAQFLDLATYGQLVTMISGQLLLSRALMPGIESGVTRLRTLAKYERREIELVRAGLRVIWGLGAAAALLAVAVCVVWELMGEPHWMVWLTAAIVGGGLGTALVDYCYSIQLAHLQYRQAASAQGGTALLRLVVIAPVAFWWPQRAGLVFLLYPLATLVAGLFQTWLLRLKRDGRVERRLIVELLRYSGWQAVTNLAAVLSLYQGTFVLNLYGQHEATGLFGLGLILSQGFFAINNAYTEYLLPRASCALHLRELRWFLRRAFLGALLLISAGLPVTLALGKMTKLLRPELHAVEPIFYCLAAALLLLIFQGPLSAAFHYLLCPHLLTCGWLLLVICTGGLSLWLAPEKGAWGVAVGQLGGTALAMLALAAALALAWRAARKHEASTADAGLKWRS